MTTMKDPSLIAYPNREQMLALIRARATSVGDCANGRLSAESGARGVTCMYAFAD